MFQQKDIYNSLIKIRDSKHKLENGDDKKLNVYIKQYYYGGKFYDKEQKIELIKKYLK